MRMFSRYVTHSFTTSTASNNLRVGYLYQYSAFAAACLKILQSLLDFVRVSSRSQHLWATSLWKVLPSSTFLDLHNSPFIRSLSFQALKYVIHSQTTLTPSSHIIANFLYQHFAFAIVGFQFTSSPMMLHFGVCWKHLLAQGNSPWPSLHQLSFRLVDVTTIWQSILSWVSNLSLVPYEWIFPSYVYSFISVRTIANSNPS